jgi:cell division protein FtsQ
MKLGKLLPRLSLRPQNRLKKPAKAVKPAWRWPRIEFIKVARRGAVIVALVATLSGLVWLLDRPIQAISIDGSFQRVSPVEVEQAVTPYMNDGFMSVDLDRVQQAVEKLPWVARARVQRRWPSGLNVLVVEQVAAARWGESGLLNTRGELFVKSVQHVPPELPKLSGPDGSQWQVAQRYLAAQGRLLEVGMRIAAVRLDARGAWEIDLDNGVTVRLGRRDVDERLERFMHTGSAVIARRAGEIAYVDMRYSNGFSIGWRTQVMPAVAPAARTIDTDT